MLSSEPGSAQYTINPCAEIMVHANVSLRRQKHKLDTINEDCQEDVFSMLECEAVGL